MKNTEAKQYTVTVHETMRYEWTITATSAEEARAAAMNQVWQSGIVRRSVKEVRRSR